MEFILYFYDLSFVHTGSYDESKGKMPMNPKAKCQFYYPWKLRTVNGNQSVLLVTGHSVPRAKGKKYI